MVKHLLLLFLLVSACVTIHGLGMMLGLRWLTRAWPSKEHSFSLPRLFWILLTFLGLRGGPDPLDS